MLDLYYSETSGYYMCIIQSLIINEVQIFVFFTSSKLQQCRWFALLPMICVKELGKGRAQFA